jgi:uncharacterized phiE125 gp8 family phage protein
MLAPVRTVAPAADVVSDAEAKSHLNVSFDDDDTFIASLVDAATERVDGHAGILGRALIDQTWRQDLAGFGDRMGLPLAPAASITSVTYYDTDNAQQTLATSVYQLLTDELGPYVSLKPDQLWPSTYVRADAVSITFVAGYGIDGSDVPTPIRAAILLMVGDLYANRETIIIGTGAGKIPMSTTVDALLSPYRRVGF